MTAAAKKLSESAKNLSPQDRIELVEDLLESLDRSDRDVDRLWIKEAEERLAAFRRGEIKAVSLSEVLSKYGV